MESNRMKQRILGKTGWPVSELALGGLFVSQIGGEYADARAAIHRALQLGINYIDTAPTYSNSEEVLGRALADADVPFMLSTKLGGRPQPFDAQDKSCLLRRDTIDILFIHEPDRPAQYDWWTDAENYRGPVLEVLDDLKKSGVIRATGLGGTTAYEMVPLIKTGRFDVLLTAFNYSLLWREAELEVLPAARRQNMGIVLGSPLQQGALARRYDDEVQNGARWLSAPRRRQFAALYQLLDDIEISLAELALRFVISNSAISCTLTGARSQAEVEANVAAVEKGPLPPEILRRINDIAAMVPFRPFEEPFGLPFGRSYRGPGAR